MFRHELKYLINDGAAQVIRSRLGNICSHDRHGDLNGVYRVSSLYFDDYCDSCVYDNLGGFKERKKFRIRIYNGSESLIKLERKIKNNNLCQKDSTILSREQYQSILEDDYSFMSGSTEPVLRDFYLLAHSRLLKPAVIVDYQREAYVYGPGRVRVTFDKWMRASLSGADLFDSKLLFRQAMNKNETIMEVKYTGFLPGHILAMIQQSHGVRQAISKYKYCRLTSV